MTTYQYEARSISGIPVHGIIEAHDKADAVLKIKETCATVTNLTEIRDNSAGSRLSAGRINEKNLSLVCKQFSIILRAGLPIVRSVELVAEQVNDRVLRAILEQVAEDVAAGYSLADSFSLRGPRLPATFIETLRAGEQSGSLELAFSRLSNYYVKKDRVRSKVVTAMTYPSFVLVVAAIVIVIIMVFAVPTFSSTFASMGTELPLATKIIIGLSDFFTHYGLIVLAMIAALVLIFRVVGSTESGRLRSARASLNIPVFGPLNRMNAASQFANTLSTMLAAGLPVMKALTVTAATLSNVWVGKAVADAVTGVESGSSIGSCLRKCPDLPPLLIEMTAVGEDTGSLEDTLTVVGEYYDNEVEQATSRAVSLLEPIMICILAAFVIVVLLAVYLPMFSMYDTIG